MKEELSIEEKAKRYDEILARATGAYLPYYTVDIMTKVREFVEYLLPELKESEDERVKEWLINLVKGHIEWLEDRIREQLSNGQVYGDELVKAKNSIAWLEKQGKNNMGISEATKQVLEDNLNKALEKETPESCNEFLEKQGEQKTADKVEPKFHEGEWVTDGTSVFQIVKIESEWYIADDGERVCFDVVHQYYHLWTIQDAKVGDILFQDLMDGMTFIFDGVNPEMAILYSFIINNDGEDVLPYDIGKPNTGIGDIEENKNIIHPATKEQCDLLFQKMYDAGYKWDAEKKELKKIKQTYTNNQFTSEQASVLNRHIDKFLEEKSAWDEDEKIRKSLINYIHCYGDAGDYTKKEFIAWIKKQGEHANFLSKIQVGDKVTRNEAGILVNISQLNRDAKPANN